MQTLREIRELLGARGLRPRRRLGQHFLIDKNLVRRLVTAAGVGAGANVLEVGPGTGTLTEELLARGCRVVAVELDRGLADLMRERFRDAIEAGRLTMIEGDVMAGKHAIASAVLSALGPGPWRLVANLPFAVATPLLMALLTTHPACEGMYVTVQREVARRLMAPPGTRDYGPVSVVAQSLAQVREIARVPASCFWPRPGVDSSMVMLERVPGPAATDWGEVAAGLVRLFARRRKQLGTVLGRQFDWPPGTGPDQRMEELSPSAAVALVRRAIAQRHRIMDRIGA